MRFEKFLLDDYLQTNEGKKIFDFFTKLESIYSDNIDYFLAKVDSFIKVKDIAKFYYGKTKTINRKKKTFRTFQEFLINCRWKKLADARSFQNEIPEQSVLLFLKYPEYAFPYLYPVHFYILQKIMSDFDIPLPPIPRTTSSLERCNYYFDVCQSFYEFRKHHRLSPVEFCSFLYGFALRFAPSLTGNEDELPAANNIFLIAGHREDCEYTLKRALAQYPEIWSDGKNMMAGDIALMYEMYPVSSIVAVFRCLSDGYDDPFNYYNHRTIIGNPIIIPNIPFKALKEDALWSKKGRVRFRMQGIHDELCSVQEYKALKKLILEADPNFPIESLPEPPPYANFYHEGIETEKDVEEQLLEPFLTKLGFDVKKEFTRQFPIRMGRGFCYYPDYVLHATGSNGSERADFIWEAKYRIPTARQTREDYGQAISYAVRLQTKGFGLVSLEGVKIWMADERGHFDFEKGIRYSWEELETPEKLGKVRLLFKGYRRSGRRTPYTSVHIRHHP